MCYKCCVATFATTASRVQPSCSRVRDTCRRTFLNWAYGRQSMPNSEVASKEAAHESGTIQNISDQPLHNPRALPRLVTLHLGHLSTSRQRQAEPCRVSVTPQTSYRARVETRPRNQVGPCAPPPIRARPTRSSRGGDNGKATGPRTMEATTGDSKASRSCTRQHVRQAQSRQGSTCKPRERIPLKR